MWMDLRRPRPGGEEARGERRGQRAARTGAARPPGPGWGARHAPELETEQARDAAVHDLQSPRPGRRRGEGRPRGLQGPGGGVVPPPPPPRAPQQSAHPRPRLPLLARLRAARPAWAGGRASSGGRARAASQSGSAGAHPRGRGPPSPLPGPRRRRGDSPGAAPRPGSPPPGCPASGSAAGGEGRASTLPPLRARRQPRVHRPWRGVSSGGRGGLAARCGSHAEPGRRRRRRAGYKGTACAGRRGI